MAEKVKIKLYNKSIANSSYKTLFVKGRINDKKGYFIVDTGASNILLNKQYIDLQTLKEKIVKEKNKNTDIEIFGFANSFEKGILLENIDIYISRYKFDLDIVVAAEHIESLSKHFSKKFNLLGFIGLDFLNEYKGIIDLKKNYLYLYLY
jgi:hypothetical protein